MTKDIVCNFLAGTRDAVIIYRTSSFCRNLSATVFSPPLSPFSYFLQTFFACSVCTFYFLHLASLFFFFFCCGSDSSFTNFHITAWSGDFQNLSPDQQTCCLCLILEFSVSMALKWWTMLTAIPNHENPRFMKGIKRQYVFGNFVAQGGLNHYFYLFEQIVTCLRHTDKYFWPAL